MEDKQQATKVSTEMKDVELKEDTCPDCGTPIRYLEGCFLCPVCGYSKCG